MKKLQRLQNSLEKKETEFDRKLAEHFDDVKSANGQPLNDKRNGRATLNRWERQNDSLRNLQASIEKTRRAIEDEQATQAHVSRVTEGLPSPIREMLATGDLVQWRKYPNHLFISGVEKARIVWDPKKKQLAHKHLKFITDLEQRKQFAKVFNRLYRELNMLEKR